MEKDTSHELKSLENKSKMIRTFGRIKSRKLSDHKNFLLSDIYKNYQIQSFDNQNSQNHLEIGFGFGDFIFNKAKSNPQINFYGCEPHLNGIAHLLGILEKYPLNNIRIANSDVRLTINNIPNNFFETIYILFPDPWPKSKHFKRRLIDQNFLDNLLADKLKKDGKIIIATDHDSYKTWILSHILKSKKFKWIANSKKNWQNFPRDWVETKYQKKANSEGRVPILIEITKNHD